MSNMREILKQADARRMQKMAGQTPMEPAPAPLVPSGIQARPPQPAPTGVPRTASRIPGPAVTPPLTPTAPGPVQIHNAAPVAPPMEQAEPPSVRAVPQPIRQNSIYHQLMQSHDRMGTQHLKG